MRVTQGMLKDTMLRNLSSNVARLEQLEAQITSGKKIAKPSDDPVGAAVILRLDSQKAQADQHLTNLDDARSWMDITDQALGSIGQNIQRARELALAAPNTTTSAEGRDAIAKELSSLLDQAVSTANFSYAGQYIFSGQATHTPAFDNSTSPPTFQGDTNPILRIIDAGVNLQVNVTGDAAIQPTLAALTQIRDAVAANDPAGMRAGLTALDAAHTTLLAAQSQIGARTNRLEAQRDRLQDLQLAISSQRSQQQDVDMAQAITDYSMQDVVYKASLQAGARAIQPSLIDYLR